MNKGRFEAFSDGVFAFAITLLVLAFTVPMHGNVKWSTDADLTRELLGLWPNLLAYALSFAVIGLIWQNHHALFRTIARIDRKTVFLNLLLLASTAFIPFATATPRRLSGDARRHGAVWTRALDVRDELQPDATAPRSVGRVRQIGVRD